MKILILIGLMLISLSGFSNPNHIIGADTRVQVTDAKARSFHNSIGLLVISFNKEQKFCTGTIVGPRSVITAAHCLYDRTSRKMVTDVMFLPGLRTQLPGSNPYGAFPASKFKIRPQYKKSLSSTDDVGLVSFYQNLPFQPLPLEVSTTSDKKIVIAGYAGDKNLGELWEGKGERETSLWLKPLDTYDVDTYTGQSGSAIRANRLSGENVIIGVHSSGLYKKNVGFFFNQDSLATIKKWIQEDK